MSTREPVALTRVPSLSSPKRSVLSVVRESSEDDGSAVTQSTEEVVSVSQNVVKNKLNMVLTKKSSSEIIDIVCHNDVEAIDEMDLADRDGRSKNAVTQVTSPNDDHIVEGEDAFCVVEGDSHAEFNDSELDDIQQLREKISSEMLSIDPLTRKKIASMQFSQSFDHADDEDDVAPSGGGGVTDSDCSASKVCFELPDVNAEDEEANEDTEDEEVVEEVTPRTRVFRNPSYQRAVTKACQINRFSIDASVPEDRQKPDDKPRTPGQASAPSAGRTSAPSETCAAIIVGRSVSFNDRLLDTYPKLPETTSSSRSNSSASRKEDSPPLAPPAGGMRRLLSTPAKLNQMTSSHSIDVASGSSDNPQRKISIKNLTSNFTRKFSSTKNSKADRKLQEGQKNLYPQMVNGVTTPSETSAVVSYEGLLRLFECPGCQKSMTPPLLQCKKGHLVCEKCKVTLKGACPLCKQRITDSPNYMMEQVCQLVRFPCQFGQFGCPEYHPPRQKGDHEQFCLHRPVHCHFEGNGCTKILPLRDMKQHLEECQWKSSDSKPY